MVLRLKHLVADKKLLKFGYFIIISFIRDLVRRGSFFLNADNRRPRGGGGQANADSR